MVPPPLQQQRSQQLPLQTGAAPVLQPGGPQPAGVAPPGGNSDTDLNMEEKELKELLEHRVHKGLKAHKVL